MLDEASSIASSDAFSRRKHMVLQRLQQRRPTGQTNTSSEVVRSRTDELDEALNRAHAQIESGVVEEQTIKDLENFLSLEGCGWSAKRIQHALKLLRKASMEASSGSQNQPSFSFSAPEKKVDVLNYQKPKPQLPISSEGSPPIEPKRVFDNVINLSHVTNETRIVTGKNGSDVKLKEIRSCQFSFMFSPATVHIQGIYDSKLVFLPIESSMLVYECVRSQIFATAQQIRIHNSHNLRLHAGVRAGVIIEACTNVSMAPYRVMYNKTYVEAPQGDAWMRPKDFDWLADGQSPNWVVAPESDWETCVIDDT
ncbi:hypothetical protein KIN20_027237 [Parelaphostrongylus tenuis]|uniref:C-CAP/cofactor C-like domain-containing protein n=1 Tax=Parelaphostrongylus tenuis TaxID=148309 RepID=A0AAD5QZ34_PARTN|nr:hypothetical protein KIN20_027237 [Parelaphostrongylus tenuis]